MDKTSWVELFEGLERYRQSLGRPPMKPSDRQAALVDPLPWIARWLAEFVAEEAYRGVRPSEFAERVAPIRELFLTIFKGLT